MEHVQERGTLHVRSHCFQNNPASRSFVGYYSAVKIERKPSQHTKGSQAMQHLANVQVPPAFLRLASALPVVAVVAFVVWKLAAILPS